MVKINGLAKEIAKQLSQFTSVVEEEVEIAKDAVTKEGVSLLKQKSPKDTGDYSKGWTRTKDGKAIVVHNRTKGQLTHILEHGHVKVNGGRVAGSPHIRPVEEHMVKDFEDRVERAIKR